MMREMTLRDRAAEIIRERLITLEYQPGHVLNQERVSAQLGIGRTPVSQAFERLALEGMVEVMPRTGIMVKPLIPGDAVNLVEVRLSCESLCVRLAIERGTDEEIARIVDCSRGNDHESRSVTKNYMTNDRNFHRAISHAAHNPVLADVLGRIHDQVLRFLFFAAGSRNRALDIHVEHIAIADAIADRDADRAEELVRAHILSSRKQMTLIQ